MMEESSKRETDPEIAKKIEAYEKKIDDILERELKSNKQLRELFEKHPEKKEQYRSKLYDSWGPAF